MRLAQAKKGQKVIIKSIQGDQRFITRIISIGLGGGCYLEILSNEKKQPLLVYGRDTTIAINRKECERITVEEVME